MQQEIHLQHLYSEVPFHELAGKSITDMNDKELEAFIRTTRALRVAPSERKKAKTSAAKTITGTKKSTKDNLANFSQFL